MAEPIQIQVEFTGAQEAAREADKVSRGIAGMNERMDAAVRAARELAAQQAAGAAAARELAARETALAAAARDAEARQAAAARAAQELADRQARASRSAQELASRQTAAAASAIALGQRLAAASNAIQGVTSALGVGGQTAGLIGRVTQTSVAMAQLGASFGPQGELVGGIVGAAIPAIGAVMAALEDLDTRNREWDEQLANLEEAQLNAARATREASEAFREQALSVADAGNRMREFIESLSPNSIQRQSQDAAARITELSDQLASVNDEMARLGGQSGAAAASRLFDLQDRAEELRRRIESTSEELQNFQELSTTRAPSRGASARAVAEEERAPSGPSEAERMYAETLAEENAALREQEELLERIGAWKEQNQEREERLALRADAAAQREKDRLEEHQQKLNEAADQARQRHEEQVEVYKSVMGVVVGGLNDALQSIISGQKTAGEAFEGLLASFLKYISEQSMLKAIFEYAEAIASFASYRIDQGAQHLAAGVAYTAVAVAAGAGSVALSAPSGATPSDQKPASPEAGAAGEGGRGGDVVINWNSPVVTAGTRAELGRDMASMIRAGSQRFGTV